MGALAIIISVVTTAIFAIVMQQANAQPDDSTDKVAGGILPNYPPKSNGLSFQVYDWLKTNGIPPLYNILAETKTGTTSLIDNEVLQEMQQAADETGEEYMLLEHKDDKTITLFRVNTYDIQGQNKQDLILSDILDPIADFPDQNSLQEVNDVRTALESRIAATEESSDESAKEEAEITVEEEEDSIGNNKYLEYRKSYDRDNNDDTIAESGTRGDEDKTDKITTKETEPAQ